MGILNWAKDAWAKVTPVLGKLNGVVKTVTGLYDKAKGGYGAFKNTVNNLPVVGAVAGHLVDAAENKANDVIKAKTGIDAKDTLGKVDKGIGIAKKVSGYLPNS